jgi:predicted ester cyclase
MSSDDNKAIVRRYIEEVLNAGKLKLIDELFVPDMHEMVGEIATSLRAAFPDMRETIESLIAEEDLVAARWTWYGTHLGEYEGIVPSGRQIQRSGMAFYRIQDGKIVEDWAQWDWLEFLEQLLGWGDWEWIDLLACTKPLTKSDSSYHQ